MTTREKATVVLVKNKTNKKHSEKVDTSAICDKKLT